MHEKEEELFQFLNNPPEKARVFTRWFWFGAAVTKDEITRELHYMCDANIGGVELLVLYPLIRDDEGFKEKHHDFYSPGFFELINFTMEQCEKLRLKFDFTLASSWPYGGPFLTDEMAPQIIVPYQFDVMGPTNYSYDFTGILAGDIVSINMVKVEGGHILENSLTDITAQLRRKLIYNWPYGYKVEELDVPEGQWRIYVFVLSRYKQRVGKPAPGAEGYVMDHCRKDVTDYYLKNMGNTFIEKVGKKRVRSFFCDSIELEGNNWTSILLEEFKKRRGYDLRPFLPALWSEIGDISPYICYDYHKTMSELTIENFFQEITEWCHKNNTMFRIQAHGTWGDILKAYASADIPEGETFGEGDCYEVNTIHRRLASSAGNIYGRNIISNESFTWLRMPRFLVNLEMLKLAADAIFLDGMNHIINHGYAYSPEEAGKPGWAFYASSLISHTNTWWEYYPEISRYIHRVTAFLQKGYNYSEVGIYLPQNDVWADTPLSELHMAMKLENYMNKDSINLINKNGYWFNYLNDEVINNLGVITKKGLEINRNYYRVIILLGCRRLPIETAQALKRFVNKGGTLIATEDIPGDTCSFVDHYQKTEILQNIMRGLFPNKKDVWNYVEAGRTIITSNKMEALLTSLKDAITPDLKIEYNENIGYVHRRDNEDDIYFIANVSREEIITGLTFKISKKGFIIIDPLHKKKCTPLEINYGEVSTEIKLRFEPGQSYLVLFSSQIEKSNEIISERKILIYNRDISEEWDLYIENLNLKMSLPQLTTWEGFEESRYYCGAGYYSKKIKLTGEELRTDKILFCLTNVHEVAEVFINNHSAGVIWKRPYTLDITEYLRKGLNEIKIKVVNLWINNCLNPENTEDYNSGALLIDEWPYFVSIIDNYIRERLSNWREREMVKKLQPSGLSGKVLLKGYKG